MTSKREKTIAAIRAALPGTKKQVRITASLGRSTTGKVVDLLHAERKIHIGGWLPHPVRGPARPIYFDGEGEDVPDTVPRVTRKEARDRYEKRLRGTEKFDQRAARHRSRWWVKKAENTPQTPFSALFTRSQA